MSGLHKQIVGLLLAAGQGRRFDSSGAQNKLLQMVSGQTVLARAAANLAAVLPLCAVLRVGKPALIEQVASYPWIVCETDGMAASIISGLQHTKEAAGWMIALADMPYVQSSTMHALVLALQQGGDIVVPTYQGRYGNPVGFSRRYLPELLRLRGDCGARRLLRRFPVIEVAVEDPGIHYDIDTVEDILKYAVHDKSNDMV